MAENETAPPENCAVAIENFSRKHRVFTSSLAVMNRFNSLHTSDLRHSVENLSRCVATSVEAARASEKPFHHLVLDAVFPSDVYAAMLASMPIASDYRPMSGRSKGLDLADGRHTRVKIDLFPEYIRAMPAAKRPVWEVVGRALCSSELKEAFVRRLEPGLKRRFGTNFLRIGMYPIPVLTRDVPGYRIPPHPDTRWKGITVQFYLPRDDTTSHVGTIFHERLPDGSFPRRTQIRFSPNTGYAFAVGEDTWHSADTIGPEVKVRDSILLTYFVDAGLLRILRNRGKRVGNFISNEARQLLRGGTKDEDVRSDN